MKTIDIFRCQEKHCGHSLGGFCLRGYIDMDKPCRNTEHLTATIGDKKKSPSMSTLEFGEEIEVKDFGKWRPAMYIKGEWVLIDGDDVDGPTLWGLKDWRFPLNVIMERGQPVIVGEAGRAMIFNGRLHESGSIETIGGNDTWIKWRLPTVKELEDIGHANGQDKNGNPWLTSDG